MALQKYSDKEHSDREIPTVGFGVVVFQISVFDVSRADYKMIIDMIIYGRPLLVNIIMSTEKNNHTVTCYTEVIAPSPIGMEGPLHYPLFQGSTSVPFP